MVDNELLIVGGHYTCPAESTTESKNVLSTDNNDGDGAKKTNGTIDTIVAKKIATIDASESSPFTKIIDDNDLAETNEKSNDNRTGQLSAESKSFSQTEQEQKKCNPKQETEIIANNAVGPLDQIKPSNNRCLSVVNKFILISAFLSLFSFFHV